MNNFVAYSANVKESTLSIQYKAFSKVLAKLAFMNSKHAVYVRSPLSAIKNNTFISDFRDFLSRLSRRAQRRHIQKMASTKVWQDASRAFTASTFKVSRGVPVYLVGSGVDGGDPRREFYRSLVEVMCTTS